MTGERLTVGVDLIRVDGDTQCRALVREDVIAEYAEAYGAGVNLPALLVFFDGETYWLADGFHRIAAARIAGLDGVEAEVRGGTQGDAQDAAAAANDGHGLRRTNEDKRNAVRSMLSRHPDWSDSRIANWVHVTDKTVAAVRATSEFPKSSIRRGADGRVYETSNIGRRESKERPSPFEGGPSIAARWPPEPGPVPGSVVADRFPDLMPDGIAADGTVYVSADFDVEIEVPIADTPVRRADGEGNAYVERLGDIIAEAGGALVDLDSPEANGAIAFDEEEADSEEVNLVVAAPARGVIEGREVLDAYWTPDAHARGCVAFLAERCDLVAPTIVEPAVGGGAWLRAVRERWAGARVDRLDIDPDAPGLAHERLPHDRVTVGDWLREPPGKWTLCIGNPPYGGDLVAWLTRSVEQADVVAYLLRETVTGSLERLPWWRANRPAWIAKVLPRPLWEGHGARSQSDTCDSVFVVWARGTTETRWDWIEVKR